MCPFSCVRLPAHSFALSLVEYDRRGRLRMPHACTAAANRRLDALRQNDFEAYKELLRQTHGPQTDEDRFKGVWGWKS